MPNIPIVPVALVASLGALIYVDKEYKKVMSDQTELKRSEKLKKYRMGLMVSSGILALLIIVNHMTKRSATSSFENRVAHAANTLRSSCNLSGPVSGPASSAQPSDDFSARVSEAAAELRKQIAGSSSANLSSANLSSSDLAAKASAEISQFIADNS